MVTRSRINEPDSKIKDLNFAIDITLLDNDATQAQLQLDALKHNASRVGLEINIDKNGQMRVNVNDQICSDNLVFNGQPIAIFDDFKYLGINIGSTYKDIEASIGLTLSAFANSNTS